MLAAPEKNVEQDPGDLRPVGRARHRHRPRWSRSSRVKLIYEGVEVFDLDLEFLTKGPEYCRPTATSNGVREEHRVKAPQLPEGLNSVVLSTLADPNIACKDWIITQYDHEVRASTVIKPLQGKPGLRGPADATVLKPLA